MTVEELYSIADTENIGVFDFELGKRETLSVIDEDGDCCVAIDPTKIQSSADEKTKLAHELGHCMTGSFYNLFSDYDVRERHENRADKWAIKKLVPKDELNNAVKNGYIEVWELAEFFNVTEDFMTKAINWYEKGNLCIA